MVNFIINCLLFVIIIILIFGIELTNTNADDIPAKIKEIFKYILFSIILTLLVTSSVITLIYIIR